MPRGFDALSFLNQEFGGPEAVVALLEGYAARAPGEAAVRKWFARGSISGAWLPILLMYLEAERGAPVSILRYAETSHCP